MAANQTLNATAQAAPDIGQAVAVVFTVLLPELLGRLFVFIAAPFLYPEMWWLLIHLILTFLLFEFYFARHEGEDLGWSAALANSIVMVFISLELLRALYHHEGTPFSVGMQILRDFWSMGVTDHTAVVGLVLVLLGLGLLTAFINYFHVLPRRIAWLMSGHTTVNLLAYFLIVVVYRWEAGRPLALDGLTVFAALIYGALLWTLIFWINHRSARKHAAKSRKSFFK